MCFMCHLLAVHPKCQDKLYKEIASVKESLNGKPVGYDQIQKMKYLDMVLAETLRIFPVAPVINRIVTKPYVMEDYDGTKVKLNVGDGIWIPTAGFHMDPQYFPNPEKFDPERFSVENRPSNLSSVYMPFGDGPRNCMGSRFVLIEVKTIIYEFIDKFRLEPCEKTQHPIKLACKTASVKAEKGFWLKVTHR